ncbi:universal stress protein [Knoellia sp. CPCC 206453]|uniref:universal stress protein n=1 Tax=Knoellia pratensis TaxID=3404796 RepID=UPI003605B376
MTLLVGYRSGVDDRSGLELAATLGRSAGLRLVVVTVVPTSWPTPVAGAADRDFARWAAERGAAAAREAEQILAEICPELTATTRWISARSVSSGLLGLVAETRASMIVIGSGTDVGHGQINIGSTTSRLLHTSPVPVAMATRGLLHSEARRVARVTCAFRDDASSRTTLERTAAICDETGAALRIATFAVRGRTMYPAGVGGAAAEEQVLQVWLEQADAAQTQALKALPESGVQPHEVTSVVGSGRSWVAALDSIGGERDDVLVVGSSREHRVERLFLGSSATKIVRHSPVPVIVVP